MRYLGGKHLIGKNIAEFMTKHCPPDTVDGYLEPFCGSLGVFKQMTDKGYKQCIASDIQSDLIEMWKQSQKNTLIIPETMTEEEYNRLKDLKSTKPCAKKAIAGFFLSFGGKYFGGYAQKWENGEHPKDYLKTFKNGIEKIKPAIMRETVKFENRDYREWTPKRMLIYCDPPYKNTEGYAGTREVFNHDVFWETVRKWSKHNIVFVSEQTCPPDFKSVWSLLKKRTLTSSLVNRKIRKEHLFKANLLHKKTRKLKAKS